MAQLPQLQAHARVLRRGPDSVQVGLVDGPGVVLAGLRPREIDHLTELEHRSRWGASDEGTRPRDSGGTGGFDDSARLSAVLEALREQRLVVESPTPNDELRSHHAADVLAFAPDAAARACAYGLTDDGFSVMRLRRSRTVLIDGGGRLAGDIGACLRQGGVGNVESGPLACGAADLALRSGRGLKPDLVILLGSGGLPFTLGEPWRSRNIPHLPVVIDGPQATVGPLIGASGPCLRCLDLYRTDRDPQWPSLLAQLTPDQPVTAGPVEAESGLRALTAGLAATFAYACLDGHDVPPGLALSLRLPVPVVSHYRWRIHPKCQPCRQQVTMQW